MVRVKICGLRRMEDIIIVNKLLPEYIGFVFAESKRQISEEKARELKKMLHPDIQSVGVFVNEDMNKILRLCKEKVIDLIQLHGDEDMDYINKLKEKLPNPIIKAVRIKTADDRGEQDGWSKADDNVHTDKISADLREKVIDYLLFDTYKKDTYGGSGASFDWNVIAEIRKPYFLAGGLHLGNVMQAITLIRPFAVDVSSGVETDGFKDQEKMIDFITKVRSV